MHISALKIQKLPGSLSGPWTPATDSLLHSHDYAALCQQCSASEAGTPLDKILDLHLHPPTPTYPNTPGGFKSLKWNNS